MEAVSKPEQEEVKKATEEMGATKQENNTEDSKSALIDSIEEYGQYSYYYAHKPRDFDLGKGKRFEGSGIIYGGDPVLIGTNDSSKVGEMKKPESKKITKYSWLDETKKVKIYIDLNDPLFKSKEITENMIDFKVDETSLNIVVVDEDSNSYQFIIKKLYDKVEPAKCKFQLSGNKLKIYLQKWIETKWRELAAKK